MIRKILTILSLIGLLLSTGAWGTSFCGLMIARVSPTGGGTVFLGDGILLYIYYQVPMPAGQQRVANAASVDWQGGPHTKGYMRGRDKMGFGGWMPRYRKVPEQVLYVGSHSICQSYCLRSGPHGFYYPSTAAAANARSSDSA